MVGINVVRSAGLMEGPWWGRGMSLAALLSQSVGDRKHL